MIQAPGCPDAPTQAPVTAFDPVGLIGQAPTDLAELCGALSEQQRQHEHRIAALLDQQGKVLLEAVTKVARSPRLPKAKKPSQADKKRTQNSRYGSRLHVSSSPVRPSGVDGDIAEDSCYSPPEVVPVPQLETQKEKKENKRKGKVARVSEQLRHMSEIQRDMLKAGSSRDGDHGAIAAFFLKLTNNRRFESSVCAVVVANAVVIGVSANHQVVELSADVPTSFRALDIVFMVVFSLELLVRLIAEGPLWFCHVRNEKFNWNIFDSLLVLSAIAEEVFSTAKVSLDMSSIRMLRTLKLVRVFRVLRVLRFFKDLRVMVMGILASLQSLLWAGMLLLFIMYLVAICLLQFVTEELRQAKSGKGVLSEASHDLLVYHYRTLWATLYTLYSSITGGINWSQAADPLFGLSPALGVIYAAYIAFGVLCVLNVITGVFVENATKMTKDDEEMVMMEEFETRKAWFSEVKALFDEADVDGSGQLDAEEFQEQLQNDMRLQAWFRKIGVHVEAHSADGLFQLLDFDGDGSLDFDEFTLALQQVHGNARSIDVAALKHDTKVIRRHIEELQEAITSLFAHDEPSAGQNAWAGRSCGSLIS